MPLPQMPPMWTATCNLRKATGGLAPASPLPGRRPATPEGLLPLRPARNPTLMGQRTSNVKLQWKEPHPPHSAQGLCQSATPHLLEHAGCPRLQGPITGGLRSLARRAAFLRYVLLPAARVTRLAWGQSSQIPNHPSHKAPQPLLGPLLGNILLRVGTCNTVTLSFFSQDLCDSLPVTVAQPDSVPCTRFPAIRGRDEKAHLPGLPLC